MEIWLLCDHREILVAERTRLINRLRWNLVVLDLELEAKIPSRKLDYSGQLQRITAGCERCRRPPGSALSASRSSASLRWPGMLRRSRAAPGATCRDRLWPTLCRDPDVP